uniref:Cytochrome c oxidase copper chaperone n=1 Tax=Strigamia maritima TaxID=126957 RepID=T1JAS6_STRMM
MSSLSIKNSLSSKADEEKPKLKPCCACPETKKIRDACIIEKGEEHCGELIEAHKDCMRKMGINEFQVLQPGIIFGPWSPSSGNIIRLPSDTLSYIINYLQMGLLSPKKSSNVCGVCGYAMINLRIYDVIITSRTNRTTLFEAFFTELI